MALVTLKTLPIASAQQVFDQVASHLLTQMKKSTWMDGRACAYRNKDGLKCAAGCLIADDEYSMDDMEDEAWLSLVKDGLVPKEHAVLISELQHLHDGKAAENWEAGLYELAEKFGLVFDGARASEGSTCSQQ